MSDPWLRALYKHAEEKFPDSYNLLIDIDRQLADLHARGMMLQATRLHILREINDGRGLEQIQLSDIREVEPYDMITRLRAVPK